MKKLITFALCAVIALSMIACSNQTEPDKEKTLPQIGGNANVEIANPFVDCSDLTTAEKLAKFEISLPDDYNPTTIRAIEDNMIEVIFCVDENEICFRKAVGNNDISGDYNVYKQINESNVNSKTITTKGNNDIIKLVTWTNNGYSYSISATEGLSQEEIAAFVN